MKKSILYILQALMVAAIFQSCQDELDGIPNSVVVTENAITDQRNAEIALNGVYYRFAKGSVAGTEVVDWRYHETVGSTLAGTMFCIQFRHLMDHKIPANFGWGSATWQNFYQLINAANGVIEGVNKLPDSKFVGNRKNEILAEARFLRAYGHWSLLSYYGQFFDLNSEHGIALRKEFVTSMSLDAAKSTVKESYDHILSDLDFAIVNGPASNKPYYATKWTAMLLKARVIINRAEPDDYNEVVSLTENIIANGPFTLETKLKDIFATKGLASKEIMLGIQPQPNQNFKDIFYSVFTIWEPSAYMKSLLENDPRKAWVMGTVKNFIGRNVTAITKYAGPHDEVSYAFRLTEAYLLQAEALVRSGGDIAKAKDRLKTVMGKAGLTDFTAVDAATSAQLPMLIFGETCKNLAYEDGQEWFALLRFPMATIQTLQPKIISTEQFILPIPKIELDQNPNMVQNPGY